jgi:hypothetical protein
MKNGPPTDLAKRVTQLEEEVRQLKTRLESVAPNPSWRSLVGVFADDPVYAEIHRVTMELIEKERARDKRRFDRRIRKAKKS